MRQLEWGAFWYKYQARRALVDTTSEISPCAPVPFSLPYNMPYGVKFVPLSPPVDKRPAQTDSLDFKPLPIETFIQARRVSYRRLKLEVCLSGNIIQERT